MPPFIRRALCLLRLNHQWSAPIISETTITKVCQRCGKRVTWTK